MFNETQKWAEFVKFALPAIRTELIAQITWANLSAACIAVAIVIAMSEPVGLLGNAGYILLLWAGFRIAPKSLGNKKLLAVVSIIPISALIAIPVTLWTGREIGGTGVVAFLTLGLAPLYFIENGKQVLYALIPFWYLQAALMAYQWFTVDIFRVGGFAQNENAASAFLLLGVIFLATHPRLKWLSLPLIAVIPFGGSRWVAVVAVAAFIFIFMSRHVDWRYLAIGAAITLGMVVGVQYRELAVSYRFASAPDAIRALDEAAGIVGYDVWWRLTPGMDLINPMIFIPLGFLVDSQLHNVPIRMAVETGLLSGLAWLGLGIYALWRRPGLTEAWWLMLAVVLLSVMYYHTWIGPLGAFWWILVAMLAKERLPKDLISVSKPDKQPTLPSVR